ncbi:hypothetical protein DBR42_21835 [Pelomonas sp. HMWF004]|nr:hypothetical protein DBR42_21835 [Pelomonas sp. HMWF004]
MLQPLTAPHRVSALVAQVAALAGMTVPVTAQAAPPAAPEVQWLRYELPPLYVTEGPTEGQGVLDKLLSEVLLPGLPGWRHRIVAVPPKRLEATLKTMPNSCVLGMLKNAERETYLHFSQPFPIRVTPGLLVRRADLARWRSLLDGQGRLALTGWLQQPDVRLGRAEGRAYGATLDAMVAAQPEDRVEQVTSQNPARNLMQMLERGRIDGMLALPMELREPSAKASVKMDKLQLLPLQEQEAARQGHVACARGPLGDKVVRQANRVLAKSPFKDGRLRSRPQHQPPP